jgi:hypothetical protein
MPKVSRDSATQRQDGGSVVDLLDELDGYTVRVVANAAQAMGEVHFGAAAKGSR